MSTGTINPFQPECTVTLIDGIERRFVWNGNSEIEYFRTPLLDPDLVVDMDPNFDEELQKVFCVQLKFRQLRAKLYAGLACDAKKRGEAWSIERVGELMPLNGDSIAAIEIATEEVVRCAKRGPLGESKASGSATKTLPRQADELPSNSAENTSSD